MKRIEYYLKKKKKKTRTKSTVKSCVWPIKRAALQIFHLSIQKSFLLAALKIRSKISVSRFQQQTLVTVRRYG